MEKDKIKEIFETIKSTKYSFIFSDPEYIRKSLEDIETNSILLAEIFVKCRGIIFISGKEELIRYINELKELDILSDWLEKYYMDNWTVKKIKNNITNLAKENKEEMIELIHFVYKNSNAFESTETETGNEELIKQEHKFT